MNYAVEMLYDWTEEQRTQHAWAWHRARHESEALYYKAMYCDDYSIYEDEEAEADFALLVRECGGIR